MSGICSEHKHHEEGCSTCNALSRIQAAAPDLLAALKRMMAAVGEDCDDDCDSECCPFFQARAAIARAEGVIR